MKFIKMQGCGNDGVFFDCRESEGLALVADHAEWGDFVRAVCDRHLGIGADFVIVLGAPSIKPGDAREARGDEPADARMRIFNADGHEAQMCSTGVRGVAKLLGDQSPARDRFRIETGRGVLEIGVLRDRVTSHVIAATAQMGVPILAPDHIPVTGLAVGREHAIGCPIPAELSRALREASSGHESVGVMSCVSMGNPHVVCFCEDVEAIDLARVGPVFERHEAFPERVNAHFAQITSRHQVVLRSWERGAGATLSCGTGACAMVVTGVLSGRLSRTVRVNVPGGEFVIEWPSDDAPVSLTGGIARLYEGTLEGELLAHWKRLRPRVVRPTIHTDRLVLRPVSLRDIDALVDALSDGVIGRQLVGVPYPYSPAHARTYIASCDQDHRHVFAICIGGAGDKIDSSPLIGLIGITEERDHRRATLGYWITQRHWGKGYASEALSAVLRYGIDTLGLCRVEATHFTENPASGRVMQKAGMVREGLVRNRIVKDGQPRDSVQYATTPSDLSHPGE